MPRVQAVLFDLDGVLIDSYHLWFHLLNHATRHFGFPAITPGDFNRTWGQGIEADVAEFMPGTSIEVVQAFYARHYGDHIAHVTREPGAVEVLQEVRRRAQPGGSDAAQLQVGAPGPEARALGCVTNTPSGLARQVLAHTGLLKGLDYVMGADEAGRSKPAPDGVLQLLERFGVRAEEAILVGDSVYDRDAARAAGVPFVGLRMEVENRIDRLEDLPGWLERWEAGAG